MKRRTKHLGRSSVILLVTFLIGLAPLSAPGGMWVRADDEIKGPVQSATRVVEPQEPIQGEQPAMPPLEPRADGVAQATHHYEPWFSYRNNTGAVLDRLDLYVAIPPDRDNQTLTRFSFSAPYELLSDRYGQQTAHLRWTDLAPDAVVGVTWEWEAQVSSKNHNVDPSRVGDLDDIPADIRALYTESGSMYRMDSAIIQGAAQDAVAGAGTLYERAYGIHRFVMDRLSYVQDGRWDDAETVYLQRHGSCTEHAWLYIALCRANGIPARYAGGMMSMSANHRWAEVYLPPYGWVPADPTWGTFGVTPSSVLVTTVGGGGSEYLDWTYNWLHWENRPAVSLTPATQSNSGPPGSWVRSTVQIRNQTGAADRFDLSTSGGSWSTGLSARTTGELADGASFELTVRARVPDTATAGERDTVTVRAVSDANPGRYSGSATVTTIAHVAAQIGLSPTQLVQRQTTDQVFSQALTLSNGPGLPLGYHVVDPFFLDAVLWLPLDEPAGATAFRDLSGAGNDGSCAGLSCPTSGVVGGIGYALEFDGRGDRLPTALHVDQSSRTRGATMAAWVYPTSDSPGRHHVISTDDGGFDWSVLREGGTWHVFDGNTSRSTNKTVDLNRWQLLVAVFRPEGNIHFYKNGMRTILSGLGYDDRENVLTLGDNAGPWEAFFEGRIDDVLVWDRALSYREVRAIDQGPSLATWLSAEPFYGTVPGEGESAVQVTFDSTGLQENDYTTDLIVQSSDPDTPLITVPVTLTVAAAAPQIAVLPASFSESLAQGATLSRALLISNEGTAALTFALSTAQPWLAADPVSGMIPAGGRQAVEVTLDAAGVALGEHSGQFRVTSDDPLTPALDIPVTMTVREPSQEGRVQGTVTDAGSGAPLAAVVAVLGQPGAVETDGSGFYQWTLEAGRYTLQVSATGHVPQTADVEVVAQQTTTQDFRLLAVTPDSLRVYLPLVIR